MTKEKELKLVEVVRSYSRKLNTGNYTTEDFFISLKEECEKKDLEKVSKELYFKCKEEVELSIRDYKVVNPNWSAHKQENYNKDAKYQEFKENL